MIDINDYNEIPVGSHQSGLICPYCKGGDSQDRSFFVARNATEMFWFCYRNKCGASGSTSNYGSKTSAPLQRRAKDTRYTGYSYELQKEDQQYFFDRFEIETELLPYGAIKFTNDDEYLFAVNGPDGEVRGHVLRQPRWKGDPAPPRKGKEGLPKALNYMQPGEQCMSWHFADRHSNSGTLYLVEDQVSAMRLSQEGWDAVALLGTRVTTPKAIEIQSYKPTRTVIALDPDATEQAIDIARNWSSYLPGLTVALFSADPKDVPAEELYRILKTYE